jgi:hypothetical protein
VEARGRVGFSRVREAYHMTSGLESDSNVFMPDVVHALRGLDLGHGPECALYKEESCY